MTPLPIRRLQIEAVLRERYFPLIPQLQVNWSAGQHDKNRLSRSLAAFAIAQSADVSPAQAANAVIDGENDNGIDAIHFDRSTSRLWLVQAKAGGAPDLGECKKLIGGVEDLLDGRFDKFNAAFVRLRSDVEEALATDGLCVIAGLVHPGEALGPHGVDDLNQLKAKLNQYVNRFDWQDLSLPVVHGWLTAEHAVLPVSVRLTLEHWSGVQTPRRAFYGVARAADLAALYGTHGKALLEKNIRHYLGGQAVNASIASTVVDRPAEFFYLNNGITAVCTSARPLPGARSDLATFAIDAFSIVNGAQTVGSIAVAAHGRIPDDARVFITVIEVPTQADPIGPEITRARNTQTAVRGVHFAALDRQQERLRQELAVSGVRYEYRSSEDASGAGNEVITLPRAASALACLHGDTRLVVAAKQAVGTLYDGGGQLYAQLFRQQLSGVTLARSVRLYDYAMEVLFGSELAEPNYSRRKMFYRHGRFFVLHILARRNRALIERAELELTNAEKLDVSRAITELAEIIFEVAEARFRDGRGYLSIFRSLTDCIPFADEVMRRLAQPTTPPEKAQQ